MICVPESVAHNVAKGIRRPCLEQVSSLPRVGLVAVDGGEIEERRNLLDKRHGFERGGACG